MMTFALMTGLFLLFFAAGFAVGWIVNDDE